MFETDFGRRVDSWLRDEVLIWLTTVRADGLPQPSPVWFGWDGDSFLIYSQPNTQKLRNIARGPRVSLNLDGDGRGGRIAVIRGEAALDANAPPAHRNAAYVQKYSWGFEQLGMSAEQFAAAYSVAVRVRPTGIWGH